MLSFVSLALNKLNWKHPTEHLAIISDPETVLSRCFLQDKGSIVTCQSIFSVRFTIWQQMETRSCSSPSCWLHLSDQSVSVPDLFLFFCCFIFLPETTANYQRAKRQFRLQSMASLLLCVYVCALNLTIGHREGSERVLCCWSPPLPFACLSDVLLGWAPHSDGVDKMTGGGTLQWMSIWLQSTVSPEALKLPHTKTEKERAVVYKKASPKELDIYIKHTGSHACITTYTAPALIHLYTYNVNTLGVKFHPGSCNYLACWRISYQSATWHLVPMTRWWWCMSKHRFSVVHSQRSCVLRALPWLAYCPDLTGRIRDAF